MLLFGNLLGFFNIGIVLTVDIVRLACFKKIVFGFGDNECRTRRRAYVLVFSGVSALSFSFSSIFSGSVSEVSAAVGSFFFVLRAVFLVTVVVFICLTLKLTLVSLRGVDYLVNFFFLGIIRVITKV